MLVIGLDLSLASTGYVELVDGEIQKKELIKSKPEGTIPFDETVRLNNILGEIVGLLNKHLIAGDRCSPADLVVLEGLAFMARNTRSIVQLAGLHFMVRDWLYRSKCSFIVVAPTTLKKFITGKGNSPKDTMMMETYKRYGMTLTNNNICDAFCLAKCGESLLDKSHKPVKLTKPQQEVVELLKVQL